MKAIFYFKIGTEGQTAQIIARDRSEQICNCTKTDYEVMKDYYFKRLEEHFKGELVAIIDKEEFDRLEKEKE